MKLFAFIKALIVTAVFAAAAAAASDLKNEDGKRYEVRVHEGSTTRNTWIDGNSSMVSFCGGCEVEVVGVGRITLSRSETAVIKDGKLSKR